MNNSVDDLKVSLRQKTKIRLLTCPSFFHVAGTPDNLQLVLTDLHCDKGL